MGHGQGGDSPESGNPGVRGWGPRTVGLLVKPRPSNRLEPPAFPAEQPLSPPQVAAAVASLRGRETYKSDARPRRGRPRPSTNSPAPAGPAPGRSSAPSPALARPCRIRSRPQTQLLPFVGAGSVPVRAARLRSGGAAGRGRAVAAGERPMSAAGGGGAARCAPLWLRRVGRCGKSAACGPGASVAPPCRPWPPPPFGRAQVPAPCWPARRRPGARLPPVRARPSGPCVRAPARGRA